jgi:hypothetical protein
MNSNSGLSLPVLKFQQNTQHCRMSYMKISTDPASWHRDCSDEQIERRTNATGPRLGVLETGSKPWVVYALETSALRSKPINNSSQSWNKGLEWAVRVLFHVGTDEWTWWSNKALTPDARGASVSIQCFLFWKRSSREVSTQKEQKSICFLFFFLCSYYLPSYPPYFFLFFSNLP